MLNVASIARLHESLPLSITIRNNHPSRAASITVQVEPDAADGVILSGLRNARLPTLLPGSEETITWKIIPIECGTIALPKIKVTNRRRIGQEETEGEAVCIIDARLDGSQAPKAVGTSEDVVDASNVAGDILGSVLVMP